MSRRAPSGPVATEQGWVYTLHLDPPLGHAKHYTGFGKDLAARLEAHEHGQGARLTQVQLERGGTWRLASAEPGTRDREAQLKDRGGVPPLPDLQGRGEGRRAGTDARTRTGGGDMTRRAKILPGPRCGWPDNCVVKGIDHSPEPSTGRTWTFHDVQCQVPNPHPGPHLDGYPECGLISGHAGDHDYVRHAAEGFLSAAAVPREPEIEAEPEPELEAG